MVDVAVLDLVVDVDIIGVEDLWVVEWWKNWLLESIGKVWVFIWRLESSDARLQAFLLAESPIEQAQIAVGDLDGARDVDGVV